MQDILKPLIDIQEIDIKLVRLKRMEVERKQELEQIQTLRLELRQQLQDKEQEISEHAKTIQNLENKLQEVTAKIKKLEQQQASIKKIEEFNAITQEVTSAEREKINIEQKVSDLVDRKVAEEELLINIKTSLESSEENSRNLEKEVLHGIDLINQECISFKKQRNDLIKHADEEVLRIYERLLRNKKDRVIVPIENRTCTGCHIVLTAQHENMVRKGTNLIFCEHCSRVLFWQDHVHTDTNQGTKKRRKKTV
ncbi:MAG: zinc ribbon domain regulatory protein CdsZ [Rhabdochlamydiaceae bacterium]